MKRYKSVKILPKYQNVTSPLAQI